MADLMDWKLTVKRAMPNAEMPAKANTVQLIGIRYEKFFNQLAIAHQASGVAITNAKINTRKSLDNKLNKEATLAPNTFLIPISFVRCSAVNNTNPNNPRHEMNMARKAKYPRVSVLPVHFCINSRIPHQRIDS